MPPQPLPSAGLIRRLLAMTYDSLLLLGITFAYFVLVVVIRNLAGDDSLQAPDAIARWFILLFWWLALSAYFVLCWVRQGQTLGMKSWRLQLQTLAGGHPDWHQCWLRCLLAPVSALAFGLGYLWCWFDRRGCWHDQWTSTRVVVLPKQGREEKDSG